VKKAIHIMAIMVAMIDRTSPDRINPFGAWALVACDRPMAERVIPSIPSKIPNIDVHGIIAMGIATIPRTNPAMPRPCPELDLFTSSIAGYFKLMLQM